MIETTNSEIDVDALMAEIRVEVERVRARQGALVVPAGPAPGEGWYALLDQLRLAEEHAAVGLEVPAFGRYAGLKRRLARVLARGVLFFGQVIAQPQRTYNASVLAALRLLAERTQALEAEVAALRARLAPGGAAPARERDREP